MEYYFTVLSSPRFLKVIIRDGKVFQSQNIKVKRNNNCKKLGGGYASSIDEYSQDNTVDPGLLWEMVKMKVREVSIKYGTTKKRNLKKEQEEIEISIITLEEQLTHSDVNDKQKKHMV